MGYSCTSESRSLKPRQEGGSTIEGPTVSILEHRSSAFHEFWRQGVWDIRSREITKIGSGSSIMKGCVAVSEGLRERHR
jgi:hypothetical protein